MSQTAMNFVVLSSRLSKYLLPFPPFASCLWLFVVRRKEKEPKCIAVVRSGLICDLCTFFSLSSLLEFESMKFAYFIYLAAHRSQTRHPSIIAVLAPTKKIYSKNVSKTLFNALLVLC